MLLHKNNLIIPKNQTIVMDSVFQNDRAENFDEVFFQK